MRRVPTLLIMATALAAMPSVVIAQNTEDPELSEWQVPWAESRPRDPYVAPDGKVWFVGQRTHYAAYLDPETGEFKKYDLDDGTGPHTLVVDGDGIVWYTGNRARHIGRLDPANGHIEKFMMPHERARDPHTFAFNEEGDLWFTVQGGNYIGKFETATGKTHLIEAPEVTGGRSTSSRPYGLKIDSQNRPWATLFNTNMLAMVDPATMELHTYELPEGARPRRLVITSDDMVYYVDYARGYLGRLDPTNGEVTEWASPGGERSRGYGMAVDKDDRVWFVETGLQPNRFVGFDPETEDFFSVTEVESGGGSIRHMYYDEANNTVWFGTDANTIGKAKLPPKRRSVS